MALFHLSVTQTKRSAGQSAIASAAYRAGERLYIRLVEESKKWVLSPERKAPKKEREYAAARLDGVINKIKNVMQTALAKIQRTLMQPEVKQAGKEQVKKKAKESIMDMLAKAKINADRDNRERWEREGRIAPKKKHDMEL